MNERKSKVDVKIIIIIILSLVVLFLIAYIIYDKIYVPCNCQVVDNCVKHHEILDYEKSEDANLDIINNSILGLKYNGLTIKYDYDTRKYLIKDLDSETIYQSFDYMQSASDYEATKSGIFYVCKDGIRKIYSASNDKIYDYLPGTCTKENGKYIFKSDSSQDDNHYLMGALYISIDNGVKTVHDLVHDKKLVLKDGYNLLFVVDEYYEFYGDDVLFIKYDNDFLSAIDFDGKKVVEVRLNNKYDRILYLPTNISNGKYYFYVEKNNRFGIMNGSGRLIQSVNLERIPSGASPVSMYNNDSIICIYSMSGEVCLNYDGSSAPRVDKEIKK